MKNLIKKWDKNIPTLNGWLSLNHSFSAEVMAKAGFDSITLDMQHGVSDYSTLIPILQALQGSKIPTLARVKWNDAGEIMKTLDAGVNGIICPMINSKKDAKKLIKWCRYPPLGERSFGPIRAKFLYEENYFKIANQEIYVFAMIETAQAIENIDEILELEGINGVYIGPADLSSSLGIEPKFDQENEEFLEKIAFILQKTKQYHKYIGIHNLTPEYAKKMAKLGFNFLTIGSELIFMLEGAKNAVKKFHQ